jgi:hypothetical protein
VARSGDLVCLVYLVRLVYLVSLVDERERQNRPALQRDCPGVIVRRSPLVTSYPLYAPLNSCAFPSRRPRLLLLRVVQNEGFRYSRGTPFYESAGRHSPTTRCW